MPRSTAKPWTKLLESGCREGGAIIWAKGSRPCWRNPHKQLTWANGSSLTLDWQLWILHKTKLGARMWVIVGGLSSLWRHWHWNQYLPLVHKLAFWSPLPMERNLAQPRYRGKCLSPAPMMGQTLMIPYGRPHPLWGVYASWVGRCFGGVER